MIIRMTVNDNDFGEIMKDYFKDFRLKLSCGGLDNDTVGMSQDEVLAMIMNHRKINELLNPNFDSKLSSTDKKFIINAVVSSFENFINSKVMLGLDVNTGVYLKNNFNVSIIDTLKDEWENGEAFYWLQHSNTIVNQ
jgi:hypothetical protein